MLIFDSFPERLAASAFAEAVQVRTGLAATVYDSQEQSNNVDPFLFKLVPPIVLVERSNSEQEQTVARVVAAFGGKLAGT